MSTEFVTKVERGRFWLLGRIFIRASKRRAACEARGEHKPQIIEPGRKLCFRCGAW